MRLDIVEAALDEAEAARDPYAAIHAGLGERYASEFLRSIRLITSQPLVWAKVGRSKRNARVRHMDRFPYSVIYLVEGDLIRIVAVMHQRQRPGYWRQR